MKMKKFKPVHNVKRQVLCIGLVLSSLIGFSQTTPENTQKSNQGSFYVYWGWNRGSFTNSDLQFSGADYDFTLSDVVAKDRPSPFTLKRYFYPPKATVPQYNFRVGYYFKENWDLSFGVDHMKYVVTQDQVATIDGFINNSGTAYDGVYNNDQLTIATDFLKFEHTDGLNYMNFEIRHTDQLLDYKNLNISIKEGIGTGFVVTKTNTKLLNIDRYDKYHITGYGFDAVLALNLTFYERFFIQTEGKGGFIHLPKVRTTASKADSANHNFFFAQFNVVFGYNFSLFK